MAPTISSLRGVDPSALGNIIRAALALESLVTVSAGIYFIFFLRHYLLHAIEAATAEVTTTALQLV
jgi:hypothetical protein